MADNNPNKIQYQIAAGFQYVSFYPNQDVAELRLPQRIEPSPSVQFSLADLSLDAMFTFSSLSAQQLDFLQGMMRPPRLIMLFAPSFSERLYRKAWLLPWGTIRLSRKQE